MAKKNPGVWISYTVDGLPDGKTTIPLEVAVHGSEISGLRRAVEIGGATVWVEHGQTVDDAIAGKSSADSGAIPGEDPLPLDDDKPKPKRNRGPKTTSPSSPEPQAPPEF